MSYPVQEQLIRYNRPGTSLYPQGFVIHSTATPGATAQNEHDYFNSGDRGASAHYFVDWETIIRCIPENEQAWHAGKTANSRFLSVEMCEPKGTDQAKFEQVWQRTVWLVADACVRYGWNTKDNVFSHRGISAMYGETDHTDPIGYLARYGRTWEQLLAAIDAEITRIRGGGEDVLDHAVVYFTDRDFSSARIVSDKLGGCAMFCRNGQSAVHPEAKSAKHLVIIGGPEVKDHPNVTNCCGAGAPETAILAAQYAQTL
ncbi:peptidoglycan recognition family protein [Paradesulfitobacterium aromaticivorans]